MNEDQVTTLLDRLASGVDVSNPPVVATAGAGRRRLRWRRGAEVGGAALAVLALTSGGLVLQQLVSNDPDTKEFPAVGPSADSLVGSWTPIMLAGNPTPPEGRTAKPISFGYANGSDQLIWSGNDGCNRVAGPFRLGRDATFRAWVRSTTQMACLGVQGSLPFSGVSAVLTASHLQIIQGRLQLTSASGHRFGVFVRYEPTGLPPTPAPLAGLVPTEAQLARGNWLGPVGSPALAAGVGTLKTAVTFEHNDVFAAVPLVTSLRWNGYDGCNWTSGYVHLTAGGRFWTTRDGTTLRGCIGPDGHATRQVTAVDIVESATQVRLVDRKLRFYDDAGQLLGILRPYPGVID